MRLTVDQEPSGYGGSNPSAGTMDTTKAYEFSWHEKSRDDLWQWLVVSVMAANKTDEKDAFFKEILDKTDGGKNCVISMQINGIEVDTKVLFERLVSNMEWIATKEASEIVRAIPGFEEISDIIYKAQKALKYGLQKSIKEMGLQVYYEDEF